VVKGQKYIRNEAVIHRFAVNVKYWRHQRGYSQEELANLINIGIAQIKRIETGAVNTSISVAMLLAQTLDIEVGKLFEEREV
jgi:transcriptional regulator with XRE-family HTH domain